MAARSPFIRREVIAGRARLTQAQAKVPAALAPASSSSSSSPGDVDAAATAPAASDSPVTGDGAHDAPATEPPSPTAHSLATVGMRSRSQPSLLQVPDPLAAPGSQLLTGRHSVDHTVHVLAPGAGSTEGRLQGSSGSATTGLGAGSAPSSPARLHGHGRSASRSMRRAAADPPMVEIALPEASPRAFRAVLQFMYSDTLVAECLLDSLDADALQLLLDMHGLARKLEMPRLERLCIRSIKNSVG